MIPIVRKHVLWELQEINWRCELHALDTELTGSRKWHTMKHWERDGRIAEVWGVDASSLSAVPQLDKVTEKYCWHCPPEVGWEDTCVYLKRLIALMSRWPSLPEQLRIDPSEVCACSERAYVATLHATADFYVRSFVRVYRRLPIVPAFPPVPMY